MNIKLMQAILIATSSEFLGYQELFRIGLVLANCNYRFILIDNPILIARNFFLI